jgi:acetyl-CoA carboxylase biotin carboxyl carrier protein
MDKERIKQLVKLLKSSSAAELSVREGDSLIRICRGGAAAERPAAQESVATPGQPLLSTAPPPPAPADSVNVTSKLVGFFYRGRGPEQEPIVATGMRVKEGQTVGFIEALRKLTEVVAPAAGEIAEIVAESGQAVQFGDVLIRIVPDPPGKQGKG